MYRSSRPLRAILRNALLAAAILLPGTAGAAEAPEQVVSTPTGEVRVSLGPARQDGPREGIGRGLIEAPPERVFRALNDVEHWHEFMPFLEQSTAQRKKDGSIESSQRLHLPFPIGRRSYRIRVVTRVDVTRVDVSRVEPAAGGTGGAGRTVWHVDWASVPGSGNVKDHHGSWTLTAAGNGATLATLSLATDPGGLIPASAMERGTTETLPWIFHGLRQHVRRSRYDTADLGF